MMRTLVVTAKCVAAGMLITTGTVLLVLPGPGIPLILAGIAILATEFAWAASLQDGLLAMWHRVWRRPQGPSVGEPPPVDFTVVVH